MMRKNNRPRLEFSFRSFKLIAEEPEAIQVVRWPVRILLLTLAACVLVVVCKVHPIEWLISSVTWLSNTHFAG
jgi:hypothetical protein